MIQVSELTKHFPHGAEKIVAVNRLSFEVRSGEVYGLLGPNGAGKTTTVRMILGLLKPTSGHSEVAGYRCSDNIDEVKRRVGLVSTSTGLYQWLTPREVLLFFADLYGMEPAEAESRLNTLGKLFDIESFMNRRCSTLSSGQKQRVNLIRALIHDPPVMLLDEPTTGLDVISSQVVLEYITHIKEQGKAVIVCTHRLDEAERICDRFGLLHQGSLRHEGTLADLQESTGCERLVEMFLQLIRESQDGENQ